MGGVCLLVNPQPGYTRPVSSWEMGRVVEVQQCVRSLLRLGRSSGSQSAALIIEYVFLAGSQTQKRLLPP